MTGKFSIGECVEIDCQELCKATCEMASEEFIGRLSSIVKDKPLGSSSIMGCTFLFFQSILLLDAWSPPSIPWN